MSRLEVLVVNDGSKDSSLDIAHDYESKYPQTFRVIDKENGNYGSCINRGLKEATGKYVKVLDADDYFGNEVLENFIAYLCETDDDLILSDYNKVDELGKILESHQFKLPADEKLIFEEYCNSSIIKGVQMHAVTYKTQNLRSISYHQTEGISYTDQEWIFSPMTTIQTFSYFHHTLYLYLIGREGQTMGNDVMGKSMGQFKKMVLSLAEIYEKFAPQNESVADYLTSKLSDNIRFIYNRALLKRNLSMEFLNDFDRELKKCRKVYDLSGNIVINEKFPYKFIKYYRKKHSYLPWFVNVVYKTYSKWKESNI